jgi:AraC family transcriptional regulator
MPSLILACKQFSSVSAETNESHFKAVTRVVDTMKSELNRTLSIHDMSRIAYISPYHFIRVFHRITGVSPWRFHWALKLNAAKAMLVSTQMSIIDISMEVGYRSFGTFARRFAELVGMPPNRFRQLSGTSDARTFELLASVKNRPPIHDFRLIGRVNVPCNFHGSLVVACFPTALAQGRPLEFAWADANGCFAMPLPANVDFYIFAFALPRSGGISPWFTDDLVLRNNEFRSLTNRDFLLKGDCFLNISLRPKEATDPPILLSIGTLIEDFAIDRDFSDRLAHVPRSMPALTSTCRDLRQVERRRPHAAF